MGMNKGSHHLTTLFLSRQFQPNNLPVYKLCETVPTQLMWSNPKYQHCLSNTTGLHQGWKKVMQLEYGNWCRFAPSHCYTLSRHLQPKQPDSIQTETMQPMWWNPNINICLSNATGLHQGWKKVMQLEYGNWCRFAPSHCYTLSRHLQPNNLTVYKLWQCNPCGETQTSTFACPMLRVCIKVGRKVMQLEYGNWCRFAPSHCHTSSSQLQPNNLTVYKLRQCNPCGATQTSARICSIPLVCTKVGSKT